MIKLKLDEFCMETNHRAMWNYIADKIKKEGKIKHNGIWYKRQWPGMKTLGTYNLKLSVLCFACEQVAISQTICDDCPITKKRSSYISYCQSVSHPYSKFQNAIKDKNIHDAIKYAKELANIKWRKIK